MRKTFVAKNIKYLRSIAPKKTQSQLAAELGLKNGQNIGNWEQGLHEPSLAEITKMASLFGVDVTDFIFRDMELYANLEKEQYIISIAEETINLPEIWKTLELKHQGDYDYQKIHSPKDLYKIYLKHYPKEMQIARTFYNYKMMLKGDDEGEEQAKKTG